ncbi:glycosyl hydrolase [Paenibacillus faecalis]|uniref:glycosyl hydrolase n=1 Tax=Paenibacillus faecalis TaxID=2079532 RepID=UPI000D0F8429|nr:glycosyl hydrolase [Paenibacillus faecalis]
MQYRRWFTAMLGAVICISLTTPAYADTKNISAGAGSYTHVLPTGAAKPQSNIYKTSKVTGKIPTNDWWSSLAWDTYSQAQYPHPLAVKNGERGIQIYNPGPRIKTDRTEISGSIDHSRDFMVGHSGTDTFPDTKVDDYSDWFVTAEYKNGTKSMKVSYGHGSPFVYFTYANGNPEISFNSIPKVWYGNQSSSAIAITIDGAHYGLYGPAGSHWNGIGTRKLTNSLHGKDYFSIAALPDNKPATFEKYKQYAYSHVTDTKVDWTYDPSTSEVITTFTYDTKAKEGSQKGTLFALYPHQWKHLSGTHLLPYIYSSVRGPMKTGEGTSFQTKMKYTGVLPSLPDKGSYNRDKLAQYIEDIKDEDYYGAPDTYSVGKYLGKLTTLVPIAEQIGEVEAAEKLHNKIKFILEDWLTAHDPLGNSNLSELFYYNSQWGTLIGYPASYGSDRELNDHHIHYGYFIKAAAEIARSDPNWARDDQYGSMVQMLIRDIASSDRSDPMFPFLRSFDPYSGHSWSSGHGRYGDGNHNGSSAETMNAWAALILWGEATGETDIRNLGIYLYTTEMNAINEYWFNKYDSNDRSGFSQSKASMIWGGKTTGDSTMWTTNPEEVHGVNWMPFTGSSLYLTHDPSYAEKNYAALIKENGGSDFNAWEDLMYMYLAISDPSSAVKYFASQAESMVPEQGNSKANAYYWIHNLDSLGTQDPDITSDYPLYAVFDKNGRKTYVVYNMSDAEKIITFSDGTVITASPNRFTSIEKE